MQKTQNNLLNNEAQKLINELDLINVITDTITLDDDVKLEILRSLHLFNLGQIYKLNKIIKDAEYQIDNLDKNNGILLILD